MTSSVLQDRKECFFCGSVYALEKHHCLHGSRRKIADKYGLTVYLCHECHTGDHGVHFDRHKDEVLKRLAQKKFTEEYGEEEWFRVVGKNYL